MQIKSAQKGQYNAQLDTDPYHIIMHSSKGHIISEQPLVLLSNKRRHIRPVIEKNESTDTLNECHVIPRINGENHKHPLLQHGKLKFSHGQLCPYRHVKLKTNVIHFGTAQDPLRRMLQL